MAITSTIPALVSKLILNDLKSNLVYGDLFNGDYQGELGDLGSQITINAIDDITIDDYTPGTTSISYESVGTTGQVMTVDLSKFWAFELPDHEKKQTINKDMLSQAAAKAGYNLAEVYDAYLRDKILGTAGVITTDLGNDTTSLNVGTSGDVTAPEFFARVAKKLDEANLPRKGRAIVIPPALLENLVLNSEFTASNESLSNGFVGRYFGFDIMVTNAVEHTAGAKYKIIATSTLCATRAVQIDSVETLRLETSFATGVRGYLTGAAKVTRPSAVAVATIDIV